MQRIRKYDTEGNVLTEDQPGRLEIICDDCGKKTDWAHWYMGMDRKNILDVCSSCHVERKIKRAEKVTSFLKEKNIEKAKAKKDCQGGRS